MHTQLLFEMDSKDVLVAVMFYRHERRISGMGENFLIRPTDLARGKYVHLSRLKWKVQGQSLQVLVCYKFLSL